MSARVSNYKDTLNLPSTAVSDEGQSAPTASRNCCKYWDEIDLYAKLRELGQGRPRFVLHDGPPYANGDIHIGHAVNKILKDIIVKSKTLSGFDAPYIPGWDCHGLPIELNVEKKVGKVGHQGGRKHLPHQMPRLRPQAGGRPAQGFHPSRGIR